MSLTNMISIMDQCRKQGKGCGSFSTYSMEEVMGAILAAEETKTPVILQLAEARFVTAPLEYMGAMMLAAAKDAEVPIAVHLDHGKTLDSVEKSLEMGFTSVMIDGSAESFDENVKLTNETIELAQEYHADVEAELGVVGRSEDKYTVTYTRPEDAKAFIDATHVDALAVGIGNLHGNYPGGTPHLRLDILQKIHNVIPDQHLVLHGGSGISDADFQKCIRNGVTKININTAILNNMLKAAEEYLSDDEKNKIDFYGLNRVLVASACQTVKHHIEVFNMVPLHAED